MQRRALLVTSVLLAGSPLAQQRLSFSTKAPLPLATGEAHKLFAQCSRDAPQPEGALWTPRRSDVSAFQLALVEHMASASARGEPVPPLALTYEGQYAGFTRAGRRYIYGSHFPFGATHAPSRRGGAIVVCDGGPAFWGAVFDVATHRVSELALNGGK